MPAGAASDPDTLLDSTDDGQWPNMALMVCRPPVDRLGSRSVPGVLCAIIG